MKEIPKISESEWLIMKTIWSENPITANRIVEILSNSTSWNPKTIKTLINRLVKKGAVGFESIGRVYNYYPLIEEAVFVKAESRSFLKRVFGGAVKPMLATLVESEELSQEDIEDLKRILEKK
ncbi:MAG: transcriptional regulator [Bacteroides sp. SM1_62]|nr:MAG: transcriptional regulator [Bacteroides sp. SM1_62]